MFVTADWLDKKKIKHLGEEKKSKYETITFREMYKRCQRYLKKTDESSIQLAGTKSDQDTRVETLRHIEDFVRDTGYLVDGFEEDTEALVQQLKNEFVNYSILTEELDPKNEDIDEVQINGRKNIFYVEKGKLVRSDKMFGSQAELKKLIHRLMSGGESSRLDKEHPFVNARTAEGFRVNVTHPSVNREKEYTATIRKQRKRMIDQKDVLNNGTITKNMLSLMKLILKGRMNWATVGSTGSGKTVLNNVLLPHMDPAWRSVFIENPAEMRPGIPDPEDPTRVLNNYIQLEAKTIDKDKIEDTSPTMFNLLTNALRQTPDYIVPGEIRFPEEFDTALTAALTGHNVFTTFHAESPEDAIFRYLKAASKQSSAPSELILQDICSAFRFIINVKKLADGSRRVMYITEVLGSEGLDVKLNHIYKFVTDESVTTVDEKTGKTSVEVKGRHVRMNAISTYFQEKLLHAGVPSKQFALFNHEPEKLRDKEGNVVLDAYGNEIVLEEEMEYEGERPAFEGELARLYEAHVARNEA